MTAAALFCLVNPSGIYTLPPEKLAKAVELYQLHTAIHFGGTAWSILLLWLLLRRRVGAHVRSWAARHTASPWLQGFLVVPAWLLLLSAIALPVDLFAQHVERHFGLSVQSWPSWFGDWGKSLLLTLAIGTLVVSVLYWLMRRSPRHWWVWLWLLSIPFEIAAIFVIPVFIDPMFNHFSPLAKADPALVQQLEKVVARGHLDIPPSRMFLMDASTKSTGLNAYVTGIGATKRIVVWDTTIKAAPTDGIVFIYGHEQGHYVLNHIWKGILFTALLTLLFYWLTYRLMQGLIRSRGHEWHILATDDWASLGLLLLLFTVLGFLAEPIGNSFSRVQEHHADIYGQEVIHGLVANPQQTAANDFQLLGEVWLETPNPNPFVQFWTGSHPSTAERKLFAAHYDPWRPGQHPRYFTK